MPSIYQLKSQFQTLLRPSVLLLLRAGISANQVTLLALIGSVLIGGTLCLTSLPRIFWLILPIFLFIRMALNAIDGMLAREHNQTTPLGAILNEVADVISDAALYLPFALLAPHAIWLVFVAVLMAMLSEFVGLLGPMLGASRRYDGPMGKSDRAFIFGSLGLAVALTPHAIGAIPWVFLLVTLATVFTCINRARAMLKEQA
ncbi:MAG: CDP-alcohol phosphatidyltransferase family protein [Deefgea sp.]